MKIKKESLSEEKLEKMKRYIKVYFITGGMPKVIQTYMDTRDIDKVNEARKEAYQVYLSEIDSIEEENLRRKVQKVFCGIGQKLDSQDKRFRYGMAAILSGKQNWERAVEWLTDRRMIIKTDALQTIEKPLENHKNRNVFKLYYNDIGILTFSYHIQFADIVGMDYPYEMKNHALIEQFVLQQILVSEMKGIPYWWIGEDREDIEFICESQGEIIPVKVNCWNRESRAVNEYRARYHPDTVISVTNDIMEMKDDVIKIPSFAVWNL